MAVELILLEDVQGLGTIGEKVSVAEGYARNYLVPRGLATNVTAGVLRQLEARKLEMQQEYEKRVEVARAMAHKVEQESVTIPVQAGDDDQLYGSVTAVNIVSALSEIGIQLDRGAVQLEEPIKELGVYNVPLKLHAEVDTTLKVWVVRA